jgi:hypothetical protein
VNANHDELLKVGRKTSSNVEAEGRMATLVASNEMTVDPNLGLIINRSEVQLQSRRSPSHGNIEPTAVPDHGVIASLLDAACRRLGREWDENLSIESLRTPQPVLLYSTILIVECEIPEASQIGPIRPS